MAFLWVASVVLNQVLSPSDQFHTVMPRDVDVSVNRTKRGIEPDVGDAVKLTLEGSAVTLM